MNTTLMHPPINLPMHPLTQPKGCKQSHPQQNLLLATLSELDWQRWRPHLEWIDLPLGQVLCESGTNPSHVIFPTTAIVSLVYLTLNGASAEVAVLGNDGVVGLSLLMGGSSTPSQAVVQSAGQGYRLRAELVKNEVTRGGAVLHMLLRYTQAMIAHVAQTAVCNRHHSIDQQLARRLLLALDRLPTDELEMTQELAANLLGVRREGVTAAAHKLQRAGVIRYNRGHIQVLDRHRLEQCTCECYGVVKKEFNRLLPMPLPLPLAA